MPTYGYACVCGMKQDLVRRVDERNEPVFCVGCQQEMQRQLAAPYGRVGKGGGPDQFTADVLGMPLKDLPSGLRTREPQG